jgi:hypothetical protein
MRLIYKHQHEGIWYSHNGHEAYLKGERPLILWDKKEHIVFTHQHHIARKLTTGYTREFVMFYKKATTRAVAGGVPYLIGSNVLNYTSFVDVGVKE